ncbi:MAG: Lipoate-protein ligase [Cyanobacteriota bacterium]|jgi:lipoate-protein ligase A
MPSLIAPGEQQMALDLWMLDQVDMNQNKLHGLGVEALVRFYRWQETCLSIGRHQVWPSSKCAIEVVQRPSGGSSVLHGSDLCYAIALARPPRGRRLSYECLNQWLSQALQQLGQELNHGEQNQSANPGHCFANATAADLIDQGGNKRIGSAQLWSRGSLLQHGSIQLRPQKQLWQQLFQQEPPPPLPETITSEALEAALLEQAQGWLFRNQPLALPWPEAALTSGSAATLSAIGASDNPIG